MVRSVLEETRALTLDERARERLGELQRRTVEELRRHLGPELRAEFAAVGPTLPDDRVPDEVELRIAQAALTGWLEGLFQGAQAMIAAQQATAAAQLARLRAAAPGEGPDRATTPADRYL